jgi:hypothetical protein
MRIRLACVLWAMAMLYSSAGSAQGVTCESRGGGYRECYTGFRNSPELVEQLSGTPCEEGESWGHRPGVVWVSDGCRATFDEGEGGRWSGGGNGGGAEGIVCESRDGRYRECPLATRGPVQLVEQLSSRPCVEGQSWGRNRGALWVDQGCRARFAQYYGGGGRGGRGDGGGYSGGSHWEAANAYTTECASRDNRRQVCVWDWNSGTPYLVDQLSLSPCVNGRSWGYDRRQGLLWVDQGCRAIFGSR